MYGFSHALASLALLAAVLFSTASRADEPSLALHLRSRVKVDGRDDFAVKQVTGAWPAKEAALFICDRLESRGDDNAT